MGKPPTRSTRPARPTRRNLHRTVPTGLNLEECAQEGLALAERIGNPTLLARAHIVAGLLYATEDPVRAHAHCAKAEHFGRTVNSLYYVAMGITFGATPLSMLDPVEGLKELLRALAWHELTSTPLGITRGMFRDLLPAMEAVGLSRLVISLDAHLPAIAYAQPDAVAESVRRATEALGPQEAARARADGEALDQGEAIALLRDEVERALSMRAESGDET